MAAASMFMVFPIVENLQADTDGLKSDITACEKRDALWDTQLLPTEHAVLPPLEDISVMKLIFNSLKPKIQHQGDVAPEDWDKAIHKRGVVAKVKFISSEIHSYTGQFEGNPCALIRLSLTYSPKKRGFAPGVALKMFHHGDQPSNNVSLLTGLSSLGDNHNFFQKPFSNFVPFEKDFGIKIINFIFGIYAKAPNYIGVQNFGLKTVDNFVEESPVSPMQIFLVAPKELNYASSSERDFRESLKDIKAGTKIFEVYGYSPSESLREVLNDKKYSKELSHEQSAKNLENAELLGTIVLESDFIASEFGDLGLFFQHESLKDSNAILNKN